MKTIKVGLIGTGYIGVVHLEMLRRLGGVEVVAVADPERGSRRGGRRSGSASRRSMPTRLASSPTGRSRSSTTAPRTTSHFEINAECHPGRERGAFGEAAGPRFRGIGASSLRSPKGTAP
ncbi:MAG: hypothetical protein M0C28_27455 [Candidatus Moduliflexus flocculans]|nr:hypothetical protein [Candidatus Moduliflexus flocculans]